MTAQDEGDATGSARPLRVLSVCEDLEGAMRLADYLPLLPPKLQRTDLDLPGALALLQDNLTVPFDLVIFAPAPAEGRNRLVARRLMDLASCTATRCVVLLSPGAEPPEGLAAGVEVLSGPPFHPLDPPNEGEAPAPGLWQRLRGRLSRSRGAPEVQVAAPAPLQLIALQGLAGGCGSTTLACSLAAALARSAPDLQVLLIDLDLQGGNVSTYCDLPDDQRISDFYGRFSLLDLEALRLCLQPLGDNLQVFAGPSEILPHEAISSAGMPQFLAMARSLADVVILDLPVAIHDWHAPIWRASDLLALVAEPDVRCSHNLRRLKQLSEGQIMTPGRSELWLNRSAAPRAGQEDPGLAAFLRGAAAPELRWLPDGGAALHQAQVAGEIFGPAGRDPLSRAMAALSSDLLPRIRARVAKDATRAGVTADV